MDPSGIPPGVTVTPINGGAPVAAAAPPPPSGVPDGVTVTPINAPAAPKSAPAAAAPAAPDEDSFLQQAKEAAQGFGKGLAETGSTLGKLFHPMSSESALDLAPGAKAAVEGAAAAPTPDTTAGKTGYGLENVAEFVLGDEAVKGMSIAQKLKHVAPVMDLMEKYPRMAEVVQAGLKNFGLGTTQATAHGADATDALEQGAVAGGAGAVLHGAGELVGDLRAKNLAETNRIAAETAAHEAGPGIAKKQTASMIADRQAAAQGGVKDVAQRAAQTGLDRINDAVAPDLSITGQPIEGTEFTPADSKGIAANVKTFGDVANAYRDAVKPIADTLNDASDGQLQKLQKMRSAGYKAGDYDAVESADTQLDKLIDDHKDVVSAKQYQAFRQTYRDSKVLDQLHAATEGAFNGLSEEAAAKPGTGARALKGTMLQKRLGTMLAKIPSADVERVIGPDGLDNLHRAANLVSTPELRQATQQLAEQVAQQFPKPAKAGDASVGAQLGKHAAVSAAGALASHLLGGNAYEGVLGAEGTRYVLRQMITNPQVGKMMDYAVRNGVESKKAAGLIANLVSQGMDQNRSK